MRATAVVSAREPSNVISPERPHMHCDLTRRRRVPRREWVDVTRSQPGRSTWNVDEGGPRWGAALVRGASDQRRGPWPGRAERTLGAAVPVRALTAATTSTRPVPLSNDVW